MGELLSNGERTVRREENVKEFVVWGVIVILPGIARNSGKTGENVPGPNSIHSEDRLNNSNRILKKGLACIDRMIDHVALKRVMPITANQS